MMRVVFMGTPDFAVPSLEALLESEHELVGVVTVPDRPAGRGKKPKPSPVKVKAEEKGLPLAQPEDLRDPHFLNTLHEWKPDLQVVVAFRLLPKAVWSLPPYGTINLHASLLPYYRGAAPIQRALMNGEQETGVTTFFIDEGMDRGKILLQEKVRVEAETTAGELHDRLMEVGSRLVKRSVDGLATGELEGMEQSPLPEEEEKEKGKAPKLNKGDRILDWRLPASTIHDRVRGLSPYPGALTLLRTGKGQEFSVKLLKTRLPDNEQWGDEGAPGQILWADEKGFLVATGEGVLLVLKLQAAGRKPMDVGDFLRGHSVKKGDRFLPPEPPDEAP